MEESTLVCVPPGSAESIGLQPAAWVFNNQGQKNSLGQMAASGSAQLPGLPLVFPSPGFPAVSPCYRSRTYLCIPNTPEGEVSIKGSSVAPRFSLGKDPISWGEAAPHLPHRHLCPGEGAGTRLDGQREQAPG